MPKGKVGNPEVFLRHKNPSGILSRSHNIKAPKEVHEAFARLGAEERGRIIRLGLEVAK